jgi:hypothetical protein
MKHKNKTRECHHLEKEHATTRDTPVTQLSQHSPENSRKTHENTHQTQNTKTQTNTQNMTQHTKHVQSPLTHTSHTRRRKHLPVGVAPSASSIILPRSNFIPMRSLGIQTKIHSSSLVQKQSTAKD